MRQEDVPQQNGMNRGIKELAYAVDESGCYVRVKSAGWNPKTVANDQAWDVIDAEVDRRAREVLEGRKSPIVWFMALHMMDIGLLASYTGISRFRVWRHFSPSVFKGLDHEILARYADLFQVTVEELQRGPAIAAADEK